MAEERSCGLEPEWCGHHGKEVMGRKGTTKPTKLVTDNVKEVRGGRPQCDRAPTCMVWEKVVHEQNPKGFSVNSVSPLKAGRGLTAP